MKLTVTQIEEIRLDEALRRFDDGMGELLEVFEWLSVLEESLEAIGFKPESEGWFDEEWRADLGWKLKQLKQVLEEARQG